MEKSILCGLTFPMTICGGEKWGATRLIDMVRRLQPGIIIDNRLEVSGEGRGSLYECDPTPYHAIL